MDFTLVSFEELQNGDLLFMRDESELGSAIRTSTGHFSHVGIYFDKMIFHATKKNGVSKQDLKAYLSENPHEVFVYRYPEIDVKKTKENTQKFLGRPYNHSFYPGNDSFYCSQYIAEILPIFETIKMKFGEGGKKISDYWEDYYEKLGLPVPVDMEGTNPSQLAASEKLVFVGKLTQL